jgi:hypothetical protein
MCVYVVIKEESKRPAEGGAREHTVHKQRVDGRQQTADSRYHTADNS